MKLASTVWVIGAASLLAACNHNCTDMGCLGNRVAIVLVDDAGEGVAARGELRYTRHDDGKFDCTVTPEASADDFNCEDNTLQLMPVFNKDDEIDIRFELEDGSLSDWQPVPLTIKTEVLADFNGPGCDCTVQHGTAAPVAVPVAARLPI